MMDDLVLVILTFFIEEIYISTKRKREKEMFFIFLADSLSCIRNALKFEVMSMYIFGCKI